MTTLVVEGTAVGEVALVAVEVDVVAVGLALTDVVTTGGTLQLAKAVRTLAVPAIFNSGPMKGGKFGGRSSGPCGGGGQLLCHHETKVAAELWQRQERLITARTRS